MPDIYSVDHNGNSSILARLHAKNEDLELQRLLELNYDLLPGAQIRPDDPRRWLLVMREMPVPDTADGVVKLSIDFFFVDQSGIPTFVECKRWRDTRARREVVGQLLEYAANGQKYWTKETLRENAAASAKQRGQSLEQALQKLANDDDETVDVFLDRVMNNMREGQIRLIFFMEQARPELANIVTFLNRQMERSEVLLVEAQLFGDGNSRIVVPILYGYTEEARQVKRTVTVTAPGARHKWDEPRFFANAVERLAAADVATLRDIYAFTLTSSYGINWGKGPATGSFGLKLQSVCPRALLTFRSDGDLMLNFGWLTGDPDTEALRADFKREVFDPLALPLTGDWASSFPQYPMEQWRAKAELLLAGLTRLVERWRNKPPV